jgi:hypothetical protein
MVHVRSHAGHACAVAPPRASRHAHDSATQAIAVSEERTSEY